MFEMSWVMSWDVRKYHNGPNCMAWPQDQSIFLKIQAKTIHFIKKSTHRTSQNYLFGLIYSLSVVKPSVFGLVINWYFFVSNFKPHVVTSKICCSHSPWLLWLGSDFAGGAVFFPRAMSRAPVAGCGGAATPERYWEHAVEDGRNPGWYL